MSVVQMRKRLRQSPRSKPVAGTRIRRYQADADATRWLELREACFAGERPRARRWSREDFDREMLAKQWWRAEHLWLVEASDGRELIGSITLAVRGSATQRVAAVHWLMVHPEWRGRGIARALMATLEYAVWQAGLADVCLETHRGWQAAIRLYEALGYERTFCTT